VYVFLRLIKVLAVAMVFTGTVGALLPRDLEDRRRFAYFIAGPGYGLAWLTGFVLAWTLEIPVLVFWVLTALALSMFSLQVVLFSVGREGRRGPVTAALALLPLVATVALMLWRPVLSHD
jgi:hypothetical protein